MMFVKKSAVGGLKLGKVLADLQMELFMTICVRAKDNITTLWEDAKEEKMSWDTIKWQSISAVITLETSIRKIKKVKSGGNVTTCINGETDGQYIADIFSQKYQELYNCVPSDNILMDSIRKTIQEDMNYTSAQ